MTLTFKHFDPRLQQWVHTDGNINNPDSILTEKLDNTLLETYFPNINFSFAKIDEKTSIDDLKNGHPEGHILLLSSKSRFLYGPAECLETIDQLCPDRKDRGAYGSIFLGSCSNAITKQLNILIVDDETGENGGILPDKIAWKQVGDCHGKISPELATELSATTSHVIQHRLAIPDDFRFAKGTLAAKDLTQLPFNSETKIDLILPTSSFKGGDKKNNPIEPGLYTKTIWIGEKERSQQGTIATSQLHANFPTGLKDITEQLEEQAERLRTIQDDPRQLAQYYCEKYEKRKAFLQELSEEETTGNNEEVEERPDPLIYRLIKADLEGDGQLLETQKVVSELQRFVQREWKEIALGKTITFDRGMIIPSKDLINGEICVPWMAEGEEVLNFRSPFLNSNGMCLSTNKYVEDAYSPDGKPLEGVIVVNDEDHERIQARIEALKQQGIETNEIAPIETESERQGRDYDGDCIGVALASDFPHLTNETKYRNLPENAYDPIIKLEKASFIREDGTQPDFEEIALFMSDGISVGVINNHATAIEALESEIDLISQFGSMNEKATLFNQIATHFNQIVAESQDKDKPIPIKGRYGDRIVEITQLASQPLTEASINQGLQLTRSIYHDMVGEAGFQNQIAVDIFKSNRAPNMGVIEENQRLLHRIPEYIRDKKTNGVYTHRGIKTNGYSPVEILIQQTNSIYVQSQLESRPTEQFRDLFPENYTPAQYNQALQAKASFDQQFNAATIASQKRKQEIGPVLQVTTASGKTLEITNLLKYEHPQAFNNGEMNLKLVENKQQGAYHKLIALAQIQDSEGNLVLNEKGYPQYQKLGTVCEISRTELGLTAGMTTNNAQAQLATPLTEKQVNLLFDQAYQTAKQFHDSLTPEELPSMASAVWHVCTSPESHLKGKTEYKISNFAFASMGDEIIQQTNSLQFTEFIASGLKQYNQVPDDLWRNQKTVTLSVGEEDGQRFWYVKEATGNRQQATEEAENTGVQEFRSSEGQKLTPDETSPFPIPHSPLIKLGKSSPKSAQLPIGTEVKGQISGDLIATANLEIPGINQPITFGKMGDFEYSGVQFDGQTVRVTLKQITPPPTPVLKLDGKIIGELDQKSVDFLKSVNGLKQGISFDVTLTTLGQGSGTNTLATTDKGNTIRVVKQTMVGDKQWQEHRFSGEKTSVTLDFKQSKPAMAVFLRDEGGMMRDEEKTGVQEFRSSGVQNLTTGENSPFPIPHSPFPKLAGIFTTNQKASKEALIQAGLFRDGVTFDAKITSNITVAKITIDPESVQYPEVGEWQKEKPQRGELDSTTQKLLNELKWQPTLYHQLDEDWQLPSGQTQEYQTLRLAVDTRRVAQVTQFLDSYQVNYQQVSVNDPTIEPETQRGYVVFRMIKGEITPELQNKLESKLGQPLDANFSDSLTISPYHQKLDTIPQLSEAKLEQLKDNFPHIYGEKATGKRSFAIAQDQATENREISQKIEDTRENTENSSSFILHPASLKTSLPLRTLPTLLSVEEYEWQLPNGSISEPVTTLRLSVDPNKTAITESWLQKQGISWEKATHSGDIEAESQLGYDLIRLTPDSVSPQFQQLLEGKFGSPLDATSLDGSYYKALKTGVQYEATGNRQQATGEIGVQEFRSSEVNNQSNFPIPHSPFPINQTEVPQISGKVVSMNYNLRLHGEDNLLPVNTTIEAMRGYGRTHTTRNFEPYKAYDFKEGDIAIASDGNKQVAFRVGKQYQITPEMINDPNYRQHWANVEKHSSQELDTFQGKSNVWGLEMQPLGDYIDGKIVPFPSEKATGEIGVQNLTPDKNSPSPPLPISPSPCLPVSPSPHPSHNPLANLPPLNSSVARHQIKDVAMAEVATQFIGYSAASPDTPSSTRNYQEAWGNRANTGNYSPSDVIMVSGSGPWRGVTNQQIQATFEEHYKPLLDSAIASKSQIVVGNAQGTDQLVQNYLKERGYQLNDTGKGYLHLVPLKEINLPKDTMQITNSSVSHPSSLETSSSFIPHRSSLTIYTDGSSLGNPGDGGWGYLIEQQGAAPIEGYGGEPNTTNNRMELTAVIEGIKAVKERFPTAQITVVTDSQYVVNTMTKGWQKKANQDLWQQLDTVIGDNKPQWQWVKGHSQHPQNERCDQLAKLGANSVKTEQKATGNRQQATGENSSSFIPQPSSLKTSPFPIPHSPLIPINPEFMANNLEIQQQRTDTVAPIVAAFLEANQTHHLEGKFYTASWDGKQLSLTDNQSQQTIMIASYQGRKDDGNVIWKSEALPNGSQGLSEKDVKTFVDMVPAIKQKILDNHLQQKQSLVSAER